MPPIPPPNSTCSKTSSVDASNNMLRTQRLLREEITYSIIKDKEVNILQQLGYPNQQSQFFSLLGSKKSIIRAIITHYLNLRSTDACQVADAEE